MNEWTDRRANERTNIISYRRHSWYTHSLLILGQLHLRFHPSIHLYLLKNLHITHDCVAVRRYELRVLKGDIEYAQLSGCSSSGFFVVFSVDSRLATVPCRRRCRRLGQRWCWGRHLRRSLPDGEWCVRQAADHPHHPTRITTRITDIHMYTVFQKNQALKLWQ